jgi:hypothetical protein
MPALGLRSYPRSSDEQLVTAVQRKADDVNHERRVKQFLVTCGREFVDEPRNYYLLKDSASWSQVT